jgi:hypothetical protein
MDRADLMGTITLSSGIVRVRKMASHTPPGVRLLSSGMNTVFDILPRTHETTPCAMNRPMISAGIAYTNACHKRKNEFV